jgi:hypothetical protein
MCLPNSVYLIACASILGGCASTPQIIYRDVPVEKLVYKNVLVESPINKRNECLALCRKRLVDVLDACYRDDKHFPPNMPSLAGRMRYLDNVKSCISKGEFSRYEKGVEICETNCSNTSVR